MKREKRMVIDLSLREARLFMLALSVLDHEGLDDPRVSQPLRTRITTTASLKWGAQALS